AAPLQILLLPAVRARQVEAEQVRRFLGRGSDLTKDRALAFRVALVGLWRTATDRLRKSRALDPLVTQERRAAFLLDVRLEGGQLVIDDGVYRLLAVVLSRRATQAPELLGVAEALGIQRAVAVFDAVPRRERP